MYVFPDINILKPSSRLSKCKVTENIIEFRCQAMLSTQLSNMNTDKLWLSRTSSRVETNLNFLVG